MRVLAIVPTHDRTEFFEEVAASLSAQTRPADEIVVTGNCGSTQGIFRSARISNDSLDVRLNRAVAQSYCGCYFVLADDDLLAPTFIERTMEEMERGKSEIVYTDARIFGTSNAPWETKEWTKANIEDNTVPPLTALCTKAMWQKAGGYCNVPFFDWDFWWRCYYSGARATKIPEVLFHHRFHPGQSGTNEDWAASRMAALARFRHLRPITPRSVKCIHKRH